MTDARDLTGPQLDRDLAGALRALADTEGGPMEGGWPHRWLNGRHWRCLNGHVSTRGLRVEALGYDACLVGGCRARLHLTFPEDTDGPLLASVAEAGVKGAAAGAALGAAIRAALPPDSAVVNGAAWAETLAALERLITEHGLALRLLDRFVRLIDVGGPGVRSLQSTKAYSEAVALLFAHPEVKAGPDPRVCICGATIRRQDWGVDGVRWVDESGSTRCIEPSGNVGYHVPAGQP